MRTFKGQPFHCPAVCAVIMIVALSCHARALAAPFRNLDFESAVIGVPVGFQLPASQALPDWTTDSFDAASGYTTYDMETAGSTAVSVQDGLTPYPPPGGNPVMYPLQGRYSIMLQNGTLDGFSPQNAWISQTGDLPSSACSIMFSTDWMSGANLVVSLNGITIPTSLYSVGPVVNANYGPVQTYIGDVSGFAGQQDVMLQFETLSTGSPYAGMADLDGIQFATIIVPEPSSLILIVAGLLSLAGYHRQRGVAPIARLSGCCRHKRTLLCPQKHLAASPPR